MLDKKGLPEVLHKETKMVFSEIINTVGKVVLVTLLLSIFGNFIYGLGTDSVASEICIKSGFHSGFVMKGRVICTYHVNYINKEHPELSK